MAGPAAAVSYAPEAGAPFVPAAAHIEPIFPAVTSPEPAHVSADHQRIFPSAPGSAVSEPVLPPPNPPPAVSLFSMIPREPGGLPLVAWVGGVVFLFILLLYVASIV